MSQVATGTAPAQVHPRGGRLVTAPSPPHRLPRLAPVHHSAGTTTASSAPQARGHGSVREMTTPV